jgi:hypothetical protein
MPYANKAKKRSRLAKMDQALGGQAPSLPTNQAASIGLIADLNRFSSGGDDPLNPATQNFNMLASMFDQPSAPAPGNTVLNFGGNSPKPARASQYQGGKHPHGWGTFDGKRVAAWIVPELQYARAHGWKGHVTSGGRTRAEQAYLYSHPQGYPVARPGTSNHEGRNFPRGAVDVSNAAQLSRILRRRHSPLKWAGSKDAVHFSHPHGGSY